MKIDERHLLLAGAAEECPDWRAFAAELGMHEKRAARILRRWEGRAWFTHGEDPFLGRLTPLGVDEAVRRALEVMAEHSPVSSMGV